MELKAECARNVLRYLETAPYIQLSDDGDVYFEPISLDGICENLQEYNKADVYYSLFNLSQAGLISMAELPAEDVIYECFVEYITYAGHEFLEKIKDDKRWGVIKKGLGAVRNYSLSAISSIAEGVTAAAISEYLKKP